MAEVSTTWIETNGVSLRCRIEGEGPALILLHEMGGALESWNLVTPGLTERARVIRYDLRGSGLSEKIRSRVSMDDFVADLAGLFDALGIEQAVLAGSALGGAVALAFAARHSGRAKAVLALAPATGVPPARRANAATFRHRLSERGVAAMVDEAMAPGAWVRPEDRTGAGFALFRALQKAADPDSSAYMNDMLLDLDGGEMLPPATVPVHLVAGQHDAMRGPRVVAEFAQHLPHARMRELDCGHFMALEVPHLVLLEVDALLREVAAAA